MGKKRENKTEREKSDNKKVERSNREEYFEKERRKGEQKFNKLRESRVNHES